MILFIYLFIYLFICGLFSSDKKLGITNLWSIGEPKPYAGLTFHKSTGTNMIIEKLHFLHERSTTSISFT